MCAFCWFLLHMYIAVRGSNYVKSNLTLYSRVQRIVNVPEVVNRTLLKIRGAFDVFRGSAVLVGMTIKRVDRMLRVGANARRVSNEASKTVRLHGGVRTRALCQR
jgi:hypothetical protein